MARFMGLTPEGLLPETARDDVLVDVDERIAPVNKRVDDGLAAKSDTGHTHTTTDVTGLDTALAGKAATDHTHDDRYYTKNEVTELLKNRPPVLILGPTDPVPSGTAEGTLIARTA